MLSSCNKIITFALKKRSLQIQRDAGLRKVMLQGEKAREMLTFVQRVFVYE